MKYQLELTQTPKNNQVWCIRGLPSFGGDMTQKSPDFYLWLVGMEGSCDTAESIYDEVHRTLYDLLQTDSRLNEGDEFVSLPCTANKFLNWSPDLGQIDLPAMHFRVSGIHVVKVEPAPAPAAPVAPQRKPRTNTSKLWFHTGMSISTIKGLVSDARNDAIREARRAAGSRGYISSRGTWLCTADLRGDQCWPATEAECPTWDGTQKEIEKLIEKVLAECPNVGSIYISGGYDSAESMRAFLIDNDYEPWASSWSVEIWKRKA